VRGVEPSGEGGTRGLRVEESFGKEVFLEWVTLYVRHCTQKVVALTRCRIK